MICYVRALPVSAAPAVTGHVSIGDGSPPCLLPCSRRQRHAQACLGAMLCRKRTIAQSAACAHRVGALQVSRTLQAHHSMISALEEAVGRLQVPHMLHGQLLMVTARGGRRAAPVLPGLAILREPAGCAWPQLRWHVHVRVHPCVRRCLGSFQRPASLRFKVQPTACSIAWLWPDEVTMPCN